MASEPIPEGDKGQNSTSRQGLYLRSPLLPVGGDRTGQASLRWIVNWLGAGLIIFLALAGGLYVGAKLAASPGSVTPESFQNESYLAIGDNLPGYEVFHPAGDSSFLLTSAAAQNSRIILFLQSGCSACQGLLRFWNTQVIPDLGDDIELVLVFRSSEPSPEYLSRYEPLLNRATQLVATQGDQLQNDGIFVFPTVIAADRESVIRFVVSGFDRRLSARFINEHL